MRTRRSTRKSSAVCCINCRTRSVCRHLWEYSSVLHYLLESSICDVLAHIHSWIDCFEIECLLSLGLSCGLALTMYGRREEADALIDQLLLDKVVDDFVVIAFDCIIADVGHGAIVQIFGVIICHDSASLLPH